MRFPPWVTYLLSVKILQDQLQGGESLGSLIKIKPPKKMQEDKQGLYGNYSFENTAEIPLMSVVVKAIYLDKDNRILWSNQQALQTADPVFLPLQSKPLRFFFDTWKTLKRAGIKEKDVRSSRLEIVSARNATFLGGLKIGPPRQTKRGYHFNITNLSSFTIRNVKVLMIYTDEQKKPLLHPKTKTAITDSRLFNVVIPPGTKSRELTVKQWNDPKYLSRLGISSKIKTFLLPIIVDAVPSIQ
jgi:hypothetical protein